MIQARPLMLVFYVKKIALQVYLCVFLMDSIEFLKKDMLFKSISI